jgi:hypothetical protein
MYVRETREITNGTERDGGPDFFTTTCMAKVDFSYRTRLDMGNLLMEYLSCQAGCNINDL